MTGCIECEHVPGSAVTCPGSTHDLGVEKPQFQIRKLVEGFIHDQAAEAIHLGKVGKYVLLAVKID